MVDQHGSLKIQTLLRPNSVVRHDHTSLHHAFQISNLKSSSSLFHLLPHDCFLSFHTKIMYEVLILPIKAKRTAVLYQPKCYTAIKIPGDMNTQQKSAHHKHKNWQRNRHQCYMLKLQTQKGIPSATT